MDTFSLSHFAPDGKLLGSANFSIDQLSPRWLAVCGDLLDACGPVFSRSMGSTLERFSIECAGPICHFKVGSTVLYSTTLLTDSAATSREQSLAHFRRQLAKISLFAAPRSFPAFLVLDTFAPGIDEQDRDALFQLTYHFAGAYLSRFGA
jgi:hypothetical protein